MENATVGAAAAVVATVGSAAAVATASVGAAAAVLATVGLVGGKETVPRVSTTIELSLAYASISIMSKEGQEDVLQEVVRYVCGITGTVKVPIRVTIEVATWSRGIK